MRRPEMRIFIACAASVALMLGPGAFLAQGAERPKLVVKKLSGLPASAAPGDLLRLHVTVKNVGEAKSQRSKLSFSLSEDQERSDSDVPLGKKNVEALKPGEKVEVVAKLTVPAEAAGTLHAIACVTRKRCKAFPNTITVAAEPEPGFPEAYVGTASATHTFSQTGTGGPDGTPKPFSSTRSVTMTATATFERFETADGYRYDTTGGELEWSISGSSNHENGEQCTMSGYGEVPIGPFRETRFASGTLHPVPDGSLAPGGQYSLSSAYDFVGLTAGNRNREHYTRACRQDDGDEYSTQSSFYPDNWLPTSRDTCSPAFYTYTVGSDGSLVGHDSCSETSSVYYPPPNGGTITSKHESRWDWSFTPVE